MSATHPSALSRRGFLGVAGVAALSATAACGPAGGTDTGGAAASADLKLPTYQEFTGVKPDQPGNEAGLQPVYLTMPKEFIASTKEIPLKSKVSGLTETFSTPPPPMGSNPFWQRLNAKLGGDLELIIGTDPGYPEKFATILASDDLPDLMWLPPNQGIPNVGPMLEAKFADLTSYLSGDAVLDYPNLAALKPTSWRTAVVGGKIWGAPIPSTPFGQVMIGNPKAWDPVGGFQCQTAEEFFEKAKELTRPNEKKYALEPSYINMLHMFGEWFGAPNGWRVNADRTLTGSYETDEYQAAVEFAAKVFAAGCFYPDANLPDARPKVAQGQVSAYVSVGPTGIGELRDFDQTMQGEALIPFGWDGKAKPIYDMGYGTVGFTPFKQADEGRIRELLSLINFLSAPFGTAEYVQKNFGAADQDFTLDGNGNPTLTAAGQTNVPGLVSALCIMANPETVIYNPEHTEDSEQIYAAEKTLLTYAMRNPTSGTYSDTSSKVNTKIVQQIRDKVVDIITGRATMADYPAALKRWQEGGGHKIRDEYQAVLPKDVPVTE